MTLQRNVPFKITTPKSSRAPACKSTNRKEGLSNGRVLDHLFRKVITHRVKLNKAKPAHQRLGFVFELLKAKGIVITHTQIPVFSEELGVRTSLDGLGRTKDAVCVFELKSTTYTLQQHLARYVCL